MKRKSIAMLAAALCTLAITVTALAAELINAEQGAVLLLNGYRQAAHIW